MKVKVNFIYLQNQFKNPQNIFNNLLTRISIRAGTGREVRKQEFTVRETGKTGKFSCNIENRNFE